MYIEYPYLTPLMVSGSEFYTSDIVYLNPTTQSNNFTLAVEQDDKDFCDIRHAIKIEKGYFNPDIDKKNKDSTYSGLVYSQIKHLFYNNIGFNERIGLDNIDYTLDNKNKKLYNKAKVISIPQIYYGDGIKEGSVEINEYSGEQVYRLNDDGKGNLIATDKIFPTILQDIMSVEAFNSSSIIDVTLNGLSVDRSVNKDIQWIYFTPQYLFFNRNNIKNFYLTHDILGETPPYYYNSNLCYVGTSRNGPTYDLELIPSQSYSISQSMVGNFKKIECSDAFVMVLDNDGTIHLWGKKIKEMYNVHHYILNTAYTTVKIPVFDNDVYIGEIVDIKDVPFSSKIVDIQVGLNHAILLDESGKIYFWAEKNSDIYNSIIDGWSSNLSIMTGSFKCISTNNNGMAAISSNGRMIAYGLSSFLSYSNWLSGNSYEKISIGDNHGLILDSFGKIYAWGDNTYGQCSIPNKALENIKDIKCGMAHNIVLTNDNTVINWGNDNYGQSTIPYGQVIEDWLPTVSTLVDVKATYNRFNNITSICAKYDRTAIIINDGMNEFVSWGFEGLMTQYNIRNYGLGEDYTIVDLDNDYQYVVYYPVQTYSTKFSIKYKKGNIEYTKPIKMIKNDRCHTYNIYINPPKKIEDNNSIYLNRHFTSFTRFSLIDNESMEFITLTMQSIISKLGLSNSQNSMFYTQTLSSVGLFVMEKSGERINCLPITDISNLVSNVAVLNNSDIEVFVYNYVEEGNVYIYLYVEDTLSPYQADWGKDYPFIIPPALGESPLIVMDTTYENYPLNYIFSSNLIEIQGQQNIINVY